jgi:predicted small lipoprotein YifL
MMRALFGVPLTTLGVSAVAPSSRRNFSRALLLVLLAAAVGLTACGRRGPLEPPSLGFASAEADPALTQPGPDRPRVLDSRLRT